MLNPSQLPIRREQDESHTNYRCPSATQGKDEQQWQLIDPPTTEKTEESSNPKWKFKVRGAIVTTEPHSRSLYSVRRKSERDRTNVTTPQADSVVTDTTSQSPLLPLARIFYCSSAPPHPPARPTPQNQPLLLTPTSPTSLTFTIISPNLSTTTR